ncbi:peptidase, T4 family protein [Pseudooceanicola batsensis HTCC2597]|uniref:Peptidase, T4 family protein n=1 Tax=Pseudooceanicola batsensis (strain ATCC BAA-863 / DSM 15984 / KCTC 12145 / HTCC2597) TaxID=252305 RepID=A3TYF3_PSEBH|nr:P1 family peptidase [Pseudooceanicola batsensis]EAQ03187.1 peptidase, T4 family protein [Pseudooceanicola batsensis HTCC2597]
MQTGKGNLITDVPGLLVGNAADAGLKSGVTCLVGDRPFTAGVHIMGGAPGTRETDLLSPDKTVEQVDALVLSGGSAFGLDAASGVADGLRSAGRGFEVGGMRVPIVPGAILFDLLNGGDKDWADNPYKGLGRLAFDGAGATFGLGTEGAGTGATTAQLKGGLGSASVVLPSGVTVGALVAVNALGSAIVGDGPNFWAAPWEMEAEFGGRGVAPDWPDPHAAVTKMGGGGNTTIGIVATDAALTQAQCTRLATAAHDGFARALVPSHTPLDGDLIFAAATGDRTLGDPVSEQLLIGHAAAICMARAVARGVYSATAAPGDPFPAWVDRFGT